MFQIPESEKQNIIDKLGKWGIAVSPDGMIDYVDAVLPEIKCKSIHLIRHCETVAVARHEFMSDTSNNIGFTEQGLEIMRQQAASVDAYHFDVALVGPIERVVKTKDVIMQTPQSFPCVSLPCLHGIDNTGWEYKKVLELENDPIFIERELRNNVFARTPNGSSWGTVIANCVDVSDEINRNYVGKRILLISQGSVLRGLQILLRTRQHPWDEYTVRGMYHVGKTEVKKNYGVLSQVYEEKAENA